MKISLSNGVLIVVVLLICVYLISNQIREYHLQDDPILPILREILIPVHPEMKSVRLYKGDKSYTINKEKVFICLRDENGEYYPLNMLIYVTLHELAHVLNKEDVGHTEKFHQIFDELQKKAIDQGIFNPSIPVIKNYCNH